MRESIFINGIKDRRLSVLEKEGKTIIEDLSMDKETKFKKYSEFEETIENEIVSSKELYEKYIKVEQSFPLIIRFVNLEKQFLHNLYELKSRLKNELMENLAGEKIENFNPML